MNLGLIIIVELGLYIIIIVEDDYNTFPFFQYQRNDKVRFTTELNGKKISLALSDRTTMKNLLSSHVPSQQMHLQCCSLPGARGKRRAEQQGRVTKARLAISSVGQYVTGPQYDRLIQNAPLLKKFKANRKFLDKVLDVEGSVNLLKPHLIICFICEMEITLDSTGCLFDFKKHLLRHKTDVDLMTRERATTMLARWVEVEAGVDGAELTDLPLQICIKKSHSGMICLKTLEERIRDPGHDVLRVHGQTTLTNLFKRPAAVTQSSDDN